MAIIVYILIGLGAITLVIVLAALLMFKESFGYIDPGELSRLRVRGSYKNNR